MSAVESTAEPEDESAQRCLEAALEGIAKATSFYDFENAWITGLRMVSASDGAETRDRVLVAAGRRLHALGPLQDDVARRRWLDHIADEVQLRGDGHLRTDLAALAAAELRETFALASDDMKALQAWAASGAHLNKFSAQHTRAASRLRDLGRIAESLRGSGLLALCSEDEYELAADLARAMKPPVHLVPTVPKSLRVSRGDLIRWAKSEHGEKDLPRLVRSLIAETERSAEWIDMPAGTGVAMPGWDGVVRCARSNRFVPVGTSNWELTVKQNNTQDKAASDYAKRLEQSTPDERAKTAYVAVACAPWTQARAFASERSGTSDFGRVSALNVDQLEDWLACAVASTVWMREQIGKPTAGIRLLTKWWENWAAATTPPMDTALVLAGRKQSATQLRDRCTQNPGVVTVGGEVHRDEIIAFVAAALGAGDAEHEESVQALYVDSHDTAARLFAQETLSLPPSRPSSGPVLTIVVPSEVYAKHLPAGSPHRMIVPMPGSQQAAITLSAVDSGTVAKRFQSDGFEPHEAYELGGVARTSLIALRRRIANEPALHTPEWAKQHIDTPLRRCLLIGSWNETREGDREVVARFAGIPYDEATEMLLKLDSADAPLAAVDQQWYGVSPADTWVLLRDQLTAGDIKAFEEVAHAVLTEPDPLRELTGEDALRAQLDGVEAKTSSRLKRGLATTLAIAGSLPADAVAGTSPTSGMSTRVTSRALRSAMDDSTPRTWVALTDALPLLAEADPAAVLQALRSCIAAQHAFTQVMFTDSSVVGLDFSPSSPHLRVLNALEVIAWSPEHLTAAADVLARLDQLDPGGRYANRPSATLASIMCPWMPYTSATADDRLAAVGMLRRYHADAAWTLMLSMLPKHHGVQTPGAQPKYRGWRQGEPVVTQREYTEATSAFARMLVEDAGDRPSRWVDLLSRVSEVPPDALKRAVAALRQLADADADEHFKSAVWPVLREVLARHREFRDARWALPETELELLDQVLERLQPADPIAAYGHLFSSRRPRIDGASAIGGREAFEAAHSARRTEAVKAVLAGADLAAVLRFAQGVKLPRWVGIALAECDPTLDGDVLASMHDASASVTQASLGYFGVRFPDLGWDGLDQLIADRQPSAQAAADLLRALPRSEQAWNRVDRFGTDVAAEYWSRVTNFDLGWPDDLDQLLSVSRRLRAAERLDLVGNLLTTPSEDHSGEPAFAEEVAEYLAHLIRHPSAHDAGGVMAGWELAELFGVLDIHRQHIGTSQVALLEWQYYPVLQHEQNFAAPNLYRELASDPDFFVHLVQWAFKPASRSTDGTPSQDEDEQQEQLALNAWNVLHDWPENQFVPHISEDSNTDSAEHITATDDEVVDDASLRRWVERARTRLAEIERADSGDWYIGTALAATPADTNGDWPGTATRDLLENLQSDDVDRAIVTAIYNRRGVTSRGMTEGGAQERELVNYYRQRARKFQQWPRTAAIFAELAHGYEHEAVAEEHKAESRRRGL